MNNLSFTALYPKLRKCNVILVFWIALVSVLYSCKSSKKIAEEPKKEIVAPTSSVQELINLLKKNELQFDWINGKFSCDATIDDSKNSFTVSMRIRKDSAIWMSISPALGIEVARTLVTKDTVKFMNRLNSSYFIGDYNYINKLLHADLDYELVQSLLVGNSVSFYEDADKLTSTIDEEKFLLSTIRKRKIRRIEKNKEVNESAQSIWLDPTLNKISRLLLYDATTNRAFRADFKQFEKVDSTFFPHLVDYSIKAEKNVSFVIDYSKIQLNKAQTFPFSIPEKYEKIIYQEK